MLINAHRDRKEDILRFLYDPDVQFTNNLPERDLRMIKVKQKVSGGFRTSIGASNYCTIRSYTSTMRKQGHNVFDAIVSAMMGSPVMPATT